MKRRLLFMAVVASAIMASLWALPAAADSLPSGERLVGGSGANGGTVLEPVYDDMTGQIRYVSTPRGAPNPVKSNPVASAPFYVPVYPVGSAVPTLNCTDKTATTIENCPDHGPAIAGLAQAVVPGVYGGGVLGHDHLMAGPGSGGDFNVAWVPTVVLFKSSADVTHITRLAQLNTLINENLVIVIPLDGSNGTPNLTFHCSVVSAAVYANGVPITG